MNQELIKLRHQLHKYPEVSNNEYKTAERIVSFISKYNPDEILELGKTGKAFVFSGKEKGKTLVFRAELDALPITENSLLEYSSANKNVAHSCGHDGHMIILAGLATKIAKNRPQKGKVVLLFQPAEESGEGAKNIVENLKFINLKSDYIFGLHNVPGFEKNQILIKTNNITSASKGFIIDIFGKTSHASEPEKGKNPAVTIQRIILEFNKLQNKKELSDDWFLISFMHINMGDENFGISPANGKIIVSLRAFNNKNLDILTKNCTIIAKSIAKEENIKIEISEKEIYPSIINNSECVDIIKESAKSNNFQIKHLKEAFPWGEDFSYFTNKYKAGFFGLGAGINQAKLHYANYDFPDEIIETGICVFWNIYKNLIKTSK